MIRGMETHPVIAGAAGKAAFEHGLLIETAGADDQVLKVLCPLVISDTLLAEGLDILESAVEQAVAEHGPSIVTAAE